MADGPENRPGQMLLVDYGLSTPERPLGSMPWSEFTASVEDKDIRMLTSLWNSLRFLNKKYEDAVRRRDRGYDPTAGADLGEYGKPFLTKPTKEAAEDEGVVDVDEILPKPSDPPRGEMIIDVDQLYVLARTGELDDVPGIGKKTVAFTVDLLNQNVAAQDK